MSSIDKFGWYKSFKFTQLVYLTKSFLNQIIIRFKERKLGFLNKALPLLLNPNNFRLWTGWLWMKHLHQFYEFPRLNQVHMQKWNHPKKYFFSSFYRCYLPVYCFQNRRNISSKTPRICLCHRRSMCWGRYIKYGASRTQRNELVSNAKDRQCLVQADTADWRTYQFCCRK